VRSRRFRHLIVAIAGCGLALVALAVVNVLTRPAGSAQPDVTARISSCDLGAPGATAQIGYQVTNHSGSSHAYRVVVSVVSGSTTIGYSISLVNHVAAGATASARIPLPVNGERTAATCKVRAEPYDGHSGHHD
jgi:hypothetical protein